MTTQLQEDKTTKGYHLKRLEELAKIEESKLDFKVDGSIWKNGKPIAEEPTDDQKIWFVRRMRGNKRSWERWFSGHYFIQEQKKELGLNDLDIEGKGMA
jgi:hypothetical protein